MEEVLHDASRTSPDAGARLPFALDLGHLGPCSLVPALALILAEHLPEWRLDTVPFPSDPISLLPADAVVLLHVKEGRHADVTAEGSGYVVCLSAANSSTRITVAARTGEGAERVLQAIKARIEQPPSHTVPFTLWRWADGDASSWRRDLDVPTWTDIARNYPARSALDALVAMESAAGTGRLMLWTGEPGTGKTNAIRALARSWEPWCAAHLIVDPERFFGDAAYLIEVMSRDDHDYVEDEDGETTQPKARLIICEDADDFIRARHTSGAGVGRLLNVADGLLGQGLNNIVLLTSNTPVDRLDPALIRPGRLLANLEFGRFDPAGARAWLAAPDVAVPAAGLTLAELYERAGAVSRHVSAARDATPSGAYL